MTLQDIPVALLVAHPENSNFMDAGTLKKLRRHIDRTGRYEPLTVRPHPWEEGKFQVINGHSQRRYLRSRKACFGQRGSPQAHRDDESDILCESCLIAVITVEEQSRDRDQYP